MWQAPESLFQAIIFSHSILAAHSCAHPLLHPLLLVGSVTMLHRGTSTDNSINTVLAFRAEKVAKMFQNSAHCQNPTRRVLLLL